LCYYVIEYKIKMEQQNDKRSTIVQLCLSSFGWS
jgi:hypothetical protein